MSKNNNMGRLTFITFIMLFIIIFGMMRSCGANGVNEVSNGGGSKVVIGSSLERTIESHGYNVKSLIESDDSGKYYAYVNGNTAVIDDNFSSIQVRVYDNDNMLIDAFEISK